jgi:hypothetical protein
MRQSNRMYQQSTVVRGNKQSSTLKPPQARAEQERTCTMRLERCVRWTRCCSPQAPDAVHGQKQMGYPEFENCNNERYAFEGILIYNIDVFKFYQRYSGPFE